MQTAALCYHLVNGCRTLKTAYVIRNLNKTQTRLKIAEQQYYKDQHY